MSESAKKHIIERIIEANYHLVQSVIKKDTKKITKYKGQLDNLIAFVLNENQTV